MPGISLSDLTVVEFSPASALMVLSTISFPTIFLTSNLTCFLEGELNLISVEELKGLGKLPITLNEEPSTLDVESGAQPVPVLVGLTLTLKPVTGIGPIPGMDVKLGSESQTLLNKLFASVLSV